MPIYFEEDNFIEKSKPYNIDFPYFDTLKKLEKQSGLPYDYEEYLGLELNYKCDLEFFYTPKAQKLFDDECTFWKEDLIKDFLGALGDRLHGCTSDLRSLTWLFLAVHNEYFSYRLFLNPFHNKLLYFILTKPNFCLTKATRLALCLVASKCANPYEDTWLYDLDDQNLYNEYTKRFLNADQTFLPDVKLYPCLQTDEWQKYIDTGIKQTRNEVIFSQRLQAYIDAHTDQIVNICGNNYIRMGNDIITLK